MSINMTESRNKTRIKMARTQILPADRKDHFEFVYPTEKNLFVAYTTSEIHYNNSNQHK